MQIMFASDEEFPSFTNTDILFKGDAWDVTITDVGSVLELAGRNCQVYPRRSHVFASICFFFQYIFSSFAVLPKFDVLMFFLRYVFGLTYTLHSRYISHIVIFYFQYDAP